MVGLGAEPEQGGEQGAAAGHVPDRVEAVLVGQPLAQHRPHRDPGVERDGEVRRGLAPAVEWPPGTSP